MGAVPANDSAFAVIRQGRRVLLVRTRSGHWQLPGGRLKRRETHWHAARREAFEETGLRIDLLDLTGIYARDDGSCAVVFAARAPSGGRPPRPRNEIAEYRWVRWPEARRLLTPRRRKRIQDALASRRSFAAKRGRVGRWRAALGLGG